MANRQKKAQNKVLNEVLKQLVLQAERWGRKDYYTQEKIEEMVMEQCYVVKGELLAERANLEYELSSLDSNKKESLIKLERLQSYLSRADRVINQHKRMLFNFLGKKLGDQKQLKKAINLIEDTPSQVSVMVGCEEN